MQKIRLKWQNPINLARKISQNCDYDFAFFYSGLSQEIKNSKSILAIFKDESSQIRDFDKLKKSLGAKKSYENCYFGHISYEFKDKIENFAKTAKTLVQNDEIYFCKYNLIFEFDHKNQELNAHFKFKENLDEVLSFEERKLPQIKPKVTKISSNFSSKEYLGAIAKIKDEIAQGTFYQTNLTRKYFGQIEDCASQNYFEIFANLCEISPANYSFFGKNGEKFVISASPELFLKINNRKILSRPIKGTSKRFLDDKKKDAASKNYLKKSDKERAENLMIVDLVRNDLSRVCQPKSVCVNNLFKITSYRTLHHLSSEVRGQIAQNYDALDAIKSSFPPGSMTGAPKIKAIEFATSLEKLDRGVYSGSIGYFLSKNDANFNVVIRTILFDGKNFEFQVGGAITYDSIAKNELEEIFVKAKAIAKVLNIKIENVAK